MRSAATTGTSPPLRGPSPKGRGTSGSDLPFYFSGSSHHRSLSPSERVPEGRERSFCLTLVIALLACTGVVHADRLEKWEGFRRAEDVKPAFLPFLRDSVVIIETAGAFLGRMPSENPDQWVDVDKVKPDTGIKLIRDKRSFQIETCRKAGIKKCPVMKKTTYATGFILNGDTLYTCRHGFHNWLAWASKANGIALDKVTVPMRVRTVAGKILYDSSRNTAGNALSFQLLNRDVRLNRPVDAGRGYPTATLAFNAKASDIAVFKSVLPLGRVDAKNIFADIAVGQEAYLFGFPDPVKGYAGGRVNGKELAGSHGFAIDVIKERGAMRFSNYSNVGMSGAPLLSPEGQLLGMSCGSFGLENKTTKPGDVNATGITLDATELEALWRELSYD